jgi:glycosyltransferase involved in cell wall biosynthesis
MGMNRLPVSICIPTYNGARFLDDCLESARGQSFSDLEILVVDDQSSDETISIVSKHADRDSRIRIEQNPRRLGLVGNWNRCVELAQGEWIKFVFQDDHIDPHCVEGLVAAGRRAGATMVACTRRIVLEGADDEARRIYRQYVEKESLTGVFPGKTEVSAREFSDAVLDHMRKNFVGEPTAVLLHRTAFQRFGMFNPHLVSMCDLEYWIRVGVHEGLTIVPDSLATFRVHAAGASARYRKDMRYRLEKLDSLILLHEFAFNEGLAPLRAAAADRNPPIRLEALFARQAVVARVTARRNDAPHDQKPLLKAEWRAVVTEFPRMQRAFVVRRAGLLRILGWYRLRKLLVRFRSDPPAGRAETSEMPRSLSR